jgi:phosphoglycerate dehydrogenase-like enzyme
MNDSIKVAIASNLSPELHGLITDVDSRIELLTDQALLLPKRFAGDHEGDLSVRRTSDQEAAFDALMAHADILFGIPDGSPEHLSRVIRSNHRLCWVQTMAAGGGAQVKAARLTPAELDRVVFTTTAGVHGGPLAEFAVFGVLAGAKQLARLQSLQRARRWPQRWAMGQLRDQVVLVVGLGGIGREVARLVKAFGATVIGVKRRPEPVAHVDDVRAPAELADLVGRADAIVFTVPGTAATFQLYGRDLIERSKPGVVIVNVGRGTVIDEPALIEGLRSSRISSAFLDVFATEPLSVDSPLWDFPQVVVSPHTAALSPHEERNITELFADNLRRWLVGKKMRNVVDTQEFY